MPTRSKRNFWKVKSAWLRLGGFFDIAGKESRLAELQAQSTGEDLWSDADRAKLVLKERSDLQFTVDSFNALVSLLSQAQTAYELAKEADDPEFLAEAATSVTKLGKDLSAQEFLCKMSGPFDKSNAILEINSGSGGTEAQDWADMLLRLYLRWAERKGFKLEELDYQAGEGAGIKSAMIYVEGPYSYGHLRSEQGVHRLVRISPFDSNARRHTSFASISVTPDIEEEIEVVIDDKDLRVDTYRSSGAGGQHVNKTDSAVRLTHIPSGIVVACQNERSQHKNRATAMRILKAKLFEKQRLEQQAKLDSIKGERKKIDFGSQIRSYVMQPYRMVKDLRTDYQTSSVDDVLNGEIDGFIEAYLLSDENIASE